MYFLLCVLVKSFGSHQSRSVYVFVSWGKLIPVFKWLTGRVHSSQVGIRTQFVLSPFSWAIPPSREDKFLLPQQWNLCSHFNLTFRPFFSFLEILEKPWFPLRFLSCKWKVSASFNFGVISNTLKQGLPDANFPSPLKRMAAKTWVSCYHSSQSGCGHCMNMGNKLLSQHKND